MECPNCGHLGQYQGLGRRGDNWIGTTFARYFCSDCDKRMRAEVTRNESPTAGGANA